MRKYWPMGIALPITVNCFTQKFDNKIRIEWKKRTGIMVSMDVIPRIGNNWCLEQDRRRWLNFICLNVHRDPAPPPRQNCYYRTQGNVFTPVILSTGRVSAMQTPPRHTTPSLGRQTHTHPADTPPGQTMPQACTPIGQTTPPGRPLRVDTRPPRDGHCSILLECIVICWGNK